MLYMEIIEMRNEITTMQATIEAKIDNAMQYDKRRETLKERERERGNLNIAGYARRECIMQRDTFREKRLPSKVVFRGKII